MPKRLGLTGAGSVAGGVFNGLSYQAAGDGLGMAASINRAIADCIANKGGVVDVPRQVGAEILLEAPLTINPNAYLDGAGVTLRLNGNMFAASHTGWAIDILSNSFIAGMTSYQAGQRRTIVQGESARIRSTVSNAAGGIWATDTIGTEIRDVAVWNYTTGYGVQLAVTPGSVVNGIPSRWNEFSLVENVVVSRCALGVVTECDSPLISFLGTQLRKIVVEGTLNNSILYRFRGGLWDGTCFDLGGYIGQNGTTGSVALVLDGNFAGRTFANCWVDAGPDAQGNGGGSSTALTDITFGPNYTTNAPWFPRFTNCALNAPPGWRTKIKADASDLIGTQIVNIPGNSREVVRSVRDVWISTAGSDGSGDGNTQVTAFKTFAAALQMVFSTLDLSSTGVRFRYADGTYNDPIVVQGVPLGLGSGSLIILGNATTPGNVKISTTNAHAVQLLGANVSVQGLTLSTASYGRGISAEANSRLTVLSGMQFGACASGHIDALVKSTVSLLGDYTITGDAPHHWGSYLDSLFECGSAVNATNRTFSGNFAEALNGGKIFINKNQFTTTGSTGSRFYCDYQGQIQTYANNANTSFPGSSNGFVNTGQGGLVT